MRFITMTGAPPASTPDVVHRHHVRVLERARHPRLAQNAQRGLGAGRARLERLDRDVAAERGLRGEVHDAHAALAERVVQVEAPCDAGAQRPQRGQRRHRARRRRPGRLDGLPGLFDESFRELWIGREAGLEGAGEVQNRPRATRIVASGGPFSADEAARSARREGPAWPGPDRRARALGSRWRSPAWRSRRACRRPARP